MTGSFFSHFECHQCGTRYDFEEYPTYCQKDDQPLSGQYNLNREISREWILTDLNSMWRYKAFLPPLQGSEIISLGEGFTPMLPANSLAKKLDAGDLYIKDEALNPTGSFKARGLAVAVSVAKQLGVKNMAIPTAGNAGSALSAYCARAGIQAHIFMPRHTPSIFRQDCTIMGADVRLVDGSISDCGRSLKEMNRYGDWLDVSTLKEPYRLEGKKTLGYEIAEQLNWKTPDWIIYPTGGGTGLIGIWKAFEEMETMGWIDKISTRMVAVQVDACDPIVRAFQSGSQSAEPLINPGETIANGLRVPHAFGHKWILNTLYHSRGLALSVTDRQISDGIREVAEAEGIFLSPEGAATYVACKQLCDEGIIFPEDRVVMINTGSAYKYVENLM